MTLNRMKGFVQRRRQVEVDMTPPLGEPRKQLYRPQSNMNPGEYQAGTVPNINRSTAEGRHLPKSTRANSIAMASTKQAPSMHYRPFRGKRVPL
jgi:hypothetical protein